MKRIAPAPEHLHCRRLRAKPPLEFVPEPRFSGTGFGGDQDDLRSPAVRGLGERGLEDRELSLASHASRLPEEEAAGSKEERSLVTRPSRTSKRPLISAAVASFNEHPLAARAARTIATARSIA